MHFSTVALSALMGLASAQTQGTRVQVVAVGMNGTTFSPSNIRANAGEMVQFQFMGGNHTVTQSNFANPCQPISNFNSSIQGFHSGFVPAAASQAMGMIATYTIMINNTSPIWVYCGQGKHCEGGMTMVINENTADASKSLTAYRQLASQAQTVVPNGQGAQGGQTGQTGQNGQPAPAAGSSLSIPTTLSLLAAAAAGALFL